jgi:hypothetical protein
VEQAVNLYSTFAPYNYQGQRSIQAYRAWIAIYDGLFDHVEGTACGFSKWPKEKEGIAKLKKRVYFILDTLSGVYCHKLGAWVFSQVSVVHLLHLFHLRWSQSISQVLLCSDAIPNLVSLLCLSFCF